MPNISPDEHIDEQTMHSSYLIEINITSQFKEGSLFVIFIDSLP